MKVRRLSITNILGVEHLDIEPGSVTEIIGANGTGKTSIIEALKAGLGGGHDATLLRQGSEQGQIVLVLEDGVEITRTITTDESSTTVRHPQFGKISKTATYLKKLVDALSLNPIAFLTAPSKERVGILLEALPMKVDASQLGFVPLMALEGVNCDEHALTVIGKIARSIYDLRTGVNRAEKEKRATAKQMAETLPADAPEGNWGDMLQASIREQKELQASTRQKVDAMKAECTRDTQAARDARTKRQSELEAECARDIEKLRVDFETSAQKIRDDTQIAAARVAEDCDDSIGEVTVARDKKLADAQAEYEPKNKAITEKLAQAKAMVEQHTKAETTRQFIAQLTTESDKLEGESTRLTHALGRLEILKASLLEKLPIEGLEVRDGDIFVGGLPFDRVNESRRIRLAIEIAKLRAGSLGLVAVDGLERLDPKTFATFKKEAAKSGLQFVISRVTADEQLTVRTEGSAA